MAVSQWKLAWLTPNLGILWISVSSFRLCESIVANPIIYRLVLRPSRFETRQLLRTTKGMSGDAIDLNACAQPNWNISWCVWSPLAKNALALGTRLEYLMLSLCLKRCRWTGRKIHLAERTVSHVGYTNQVCRFVLYVYLFVFYSVTPKHRTGSSFFLVR